MTSLLNIGSPISAFAFNADRTQVAVCPNSELVHIYAIDPSSPATPPTLTHTLAKHNQLVTGIDWAPKSNRLVTCSQDRNGYVWEYDPATNSWLPELVMLRINRSATHVKWSPNEDKFAVASGANLVSVCYFDKDNDWWSSKHLKKPIAATVLSLDWHKNNVLLAVGGADNRARVFSAYIKGLDAKPDPNPWGERLPFGTVCADVATESCGWVHDVAFAPSGNAVGFLGHDSSWNVFYPEQNVVATVRAPLLPLLGAVWISEAQVVAVGHDCTPVLFVGDVNGWRYAGKIDEGKKASSTSTNSALAKFRAMDSRAQTTPQDTDLTTVHQNSITSVRPFGPSKYVTGGVDGRIVAWDALDEVLKRLSIA
ncbi:actin related protein 2/3 complex, subunit 1A, 41kDa [Catenaria anguillulae PL171]|uniref:Actin-related protein 2/3 complex subunit n=1 Tax=Catenaria anguillulae PL171 TaxID=765915 RepID=A0A1Y2I381_9FUNG|nr:actin related protein 2/3 complex, subunit 1A, 41kDa [Catenaria anguillulae PL171]